MAAVSVKRSIYNTTDYTDEPNSSEKHCISSITLTKTRISLAMTTNAIFYQAGVKHSLMDIVRSMLVKICTSVKCFSSLLIRFLT